MTNATDFLWASLFETHHDLDSGGERAEGVIQNLAIALKAIDISKGQNTEERLSDWDDILYVWPVQMLEDINGYYGWTQREAQDAMLWTGLVIFHRPAPDMGLGNIIDWRRDPHLDIDM